MLEHLGVAGRDSRWSPRPTWSTPTGWSWCCSKWPSGWRGSSVGLRDRRSRSRRRTGQGLDGARARRRSRAQTRRPRPAARPLPPAGGSGVLRRGVGTVVTGTAWSGRVDVGDAVVAPARRRRRAGCARSRAMAARRAHSEPGARTAVGIAGVGARRRPRRGACWSRPATRGADHRRSTWSWRSILRAPQRSRPAHPGPRASGHGRGAWPGCIPRAAIAARRAAGSPGSRWKRRWWRAAATASCSGASVRSPPSAAGGCSTLSRPRRRAAWPAGLAASAPGERLRALSSGVRPACLTPASRPAGHAAARRPPRSRASSRPVRDTSAALDPRRGGAGARDHGAGAGPRRRFTGRSPASAGMPLETLRHGAPRARAGGGAALGDLRSRGPDPPARWDRGALPGFVPRGRGRRCGSGPHRPDSGAGRPEPAHARRARAATGPPRSSAPLLRLAAPRAARSRRSSGTATTPARRSTASSRRLPEMRPARPNRPRGGAGPAGHQPQVSHPAAGVGRRPRASRCGWATSAARLRKSP